MNSVKTYEEYEQLPVSSERTFPSTPYPRTYIHGVLEDLYDAVQAVHTLRSLGFDPGDIHVMASWDFVEAVERSRQGQNRLARMLTRLLTFLDEGFGDVYLPARGSSRAPSPGGPFLQSTADHFADHALALNDELGRKQ